MSCWITYASPNLRVAFGCNSFWMHIICGKCLERTPHSSLNEQLSPSSTILNPVQASSMPGRVTLDVEKIGNMQLSIYSSFSRPGKYIEHHSCSHVVFWLPDVGLPSSRAVLIYIPSTCLDGSHYRRLPRAPKDLRNICFNSGQLNPLKL